jgi:hypothetical protein
MNNSLYRPNLRALDTVTENGATEDEEEPVNNSREEISHLRAERAKRNMCVYTESMKSFRQRWCFEPVILTFPELPRITC